MKRLLPLITMTLIASCATNGQQQPDCYDGEGYIANQIKNALSVASNNKDVQMLKTEFCTQSLVPVGVTIIPLLGPLAHGTSDKYFTAQFTARVGNRIVGAKLGTRSAAPAAEGSNFFKEIAEKALDTKDSK